jgi:hypothetical protein
MTDAAERAALLARVQEIVDGSGDEGLSVDMSKLVSSVRHLCAALAACEAELAEAREGEAAERERHKENPFFRFERALDSGGEPGNPALPPQGSGPAETT